MEMVIVLVALFLFLLLIWYILYVVNISLDVQPTKPAAQEPETPNIQPVSRSSETATQQRPGPAWMFPAGIAAIVLGFLGCFGSAVGERGAPPDVFAASVLVSMLTNPLVFIGIPLGCYWIYRSARNANPTCKTTAGNATPASTDEGNPRLTHCPDCGGHVSRSAPSCPHCGRPLTMEKDKP